MKQKALRAGDAHSHEDEECRKRPRSARECAERHWRSATHSARECAEAHSFLYFFLKLQGKGMKFRKK